MNRRNFLKRAVAAAGALAATVAAKDLVVAGDVPIPTPLASTLPLHSATASMASQTFSGTITAPIYPPGTTIKTVGDLSIATVPYDSDPEIDRIIREYHEDRATQKRVRSSWIDDRDPDYLAYLVVSRYFNVGIGELKETFSRQEIREISRGMHTHEITIPQLSIK